MREYLKGDKINGIMFGIRENCLISHILEKKWEYNEAVHQLFRDFKKTYDSV
jgi:hypothetical protein